LDQEFDKQEFLCTHYINVHEREMNSDRSLSLAIETDNRFTK